MKAECENRTVLITGATDGLGKAAALLLAERSYRVFAAGRSAEKRAQLDALAREKKLPLETLELDVCDDASVKAAVSQVLGKASAIDVLVNNAGLVYGGAVEDLRMEDWRRQFETNFFGVIRMTQAVLPHMRERRKGRILMMSSVSGVVTPPTQGAYSASKHAIEALANALRHELYPFGIETILIEPGYIVTNIQQTAIDLARAYQEKIKSGPYAKIYATYWASAKSTRAQSKTTPEDCARIMLKAIEASGPKARYCVTPLATSVKWAKRLLTDSAVDRIMRRSYGITREKTSRKEKPLIWASLWIRNLEGKAVLALFLPHFGPRLVYGAFCVVGGGLRARELDCIDPAEVSDLVAFRLQPDILDAGNFPRHVLDAIDGFFPVVVRHIVSELVDDHVQHRFWLAEAVLHRRAARVQRTRRDSCNEYRGAERHLRAVFHGRRHLFLRNGNLASLCKAREAKQLAATGEVERLNMV